MVNILQQLFDAIFLSLQFRDPPFKATQIVALGIILQDLNKISFFRTTLKICQKNLNRLAKVAKVTEILHKV